jgi:hypothetical protein
VKPLDKIAPRSSQVNLPDRDLNPANISAVCRVVTVHESRVTRAQGASSCEVTSRMRGSDKPLTGTRAGVRLAAIVKGVRRASLWERIP